VQVERSGRRRVRTTIKTEESPSQEVRLDKEARLDNDLRAMRRHL
jgi:hypothetical protein